MSKVVDMCLFKTAAFFPRQHNTNINF